MPNWPALRISRCGSSECRWWSIRNWLSSNSLVSQLKMGICTHVADRPMRTSDVEDWSAATRPTLEVRWGNAAPGAASNLRIIRVP